MEQELYPNKYCKAYFQYLIKGFRSYNNDNYSITINGLSHFVCNKLKFCQSLQTLFSQYGFDVKFEGDEESVSSVLVEYSDGKFDDCLNYQLCNLPSVLELSGKTDIPIVGIIIMKIVAQIICRKKIMYKAIVLDLDDTLWPGTISEDGEDFVRKNLSSSIGSPFVDFMHFVKVFAEEFGIYVAICSKNDLDKVHNFISTLDESVFPLKNQIDCLVVNYGTKSDNIKEIASKLSILANAIVFVDDNLIEREEVNANIPAIFVPEWSTHSELINTILMSCVFERFELSSNAQNKRKQFQIILNERKTFSRPNYYVKVVDDEGNVQANKLYAKSNQFKFSLYKANIDCKSIYFELFRENGSSLGICTAISFSQSDDKLIVWNWAISCRYFEIGIEEFVLLFLTEMAEHKSIMIKYAKTDYNLKVQELLNKCNDIFIFYGDEDIEIKINDSTKQQLRSKTNIKTT